MDHSRVLWCSVAPLPRTETTDKADLVKLGSAQLQSDITPLTACHRGQDQQAWRSRVETATSKGEAHDDDNCHTQHTKQQF